MNESTNTASSIATDLWQLRQSGGLYDGSGHPATIDEAYRLQSRVVQASGQKVNGLKVGATTDEIMSLLGVEEPFFGPLFEVTTRENGATVKLHPEHQPKVEAEFAICLKHELAQGSGALTMDDVSAAIDWVAPAFELIGTRFKETPTGRGVCTIADFGSNLDFIVGSRCSDWQKLNLDSHPVTLRLNGEEVASGHSGMSKAGSPLGVLLWLANHPLMAENGLSAGQIISCGTCTGAIAISAGDLLEADYGELGHLTTKLEAA